VTSALYVGEVTHARTQPVRRAFRYRVFQLLVDVDDLPRSWLLGRRGSPLGLQARDYLDGAAAGGLGAAVRGFLAAAGAPRPARVLLLTYPRVFGYGFNPVSFFYCYDATGVVTQVVAEVHNTYGDRHRYLVDPRGASSDKLMHVSPYVSMQARWDWAFPALPAPEVGSPLEIAMRVHERGRPVLVARQRLVRRELTDAALVRVLCTHPLMTLRVIGGIHYQAARLYLARLPFYRHPPHDPDAARRMHERNAGSGAPAQPGSGARPGAAAAATLAPRPPDAAPA